MITQTEKSALSGTAGQALAMLGGWVPDGVQIPPASNWSARSAAPGVVRYFDFDTDYPVMPNGNYGLTPGSSAPFGTGVRDTAVKCSGVSSLRFDIPSLSGASPTGSFYANFSADLQTQFGAGQSFYVQLRTRWNQAFFDTVFYDVSFVALTGTPTLLSATQFTIPGNQAGALVTKQVIRAFSGSAIICSARKVSATYASGPNVTTVTIAAPYSGALSGATSVDCGLFQNGIKLFDVNFGDDPFPKFSHYSSADGKIVCQTYFQDRFPQLYAYKSSAGSTITGVYSETFGSDFKIQNAMPSPFCLYTVASGQTGPTAGCFNIVPNEWITWQLGVTLGQLAIDASGFWVWDNSRVRLWGARENQASQLIIDWNSSVPGYFPPRADDRRVTGDSTPCKMGKVYAFPYCTTKDPTQMHALGQVWYDELIISTQQIADAM